MTFAIISGTRPEIIKLYPVIRLLDLKKIDYKFIHTGQHYDYELSLKFIDEFKIRKPDYNIKLTTPSGSVQQVSEIMAKISRIFREITPSLVLVEGDTNSVLASALSAVISSIPVGHLEAGLRNCDWKTIEEHNRRIVDHMSDILFAPTMKSARNLNNEQVHGDIFTVGNTVIDAVELCLQSYNNICYDSNSDDNDILQDIKMKRNSDFVLVTMHRAENVDNRGTLKQILIALSDSGLNYIFPIHPRTLKRIYEFGFENLISDRIKIVKPVGYFNFLRLLKMCRFVITDSGGVQEEITSPHINKHALVLRDSSERSESVQSGHAILCAPYESHNILKAIKKIEMMQPPENTYPYGSGITAEKIIEVLKNKCYIL
jgi:UDP-N-acetylglucosamine 2-epimerase (non-hydrolysing)